MKMMWHYHEPNKYDELLVSGAFNQTMKRIKQIMALLHNFVHFLFQNITLINVCSCFFHLGNQHSPNCVLIMSCRYVSEINVANKRKHIPMHNRYIWKMLIEAVKRCTSFDYGSNLMCQCNGFVSISICP